MWRWLAEQNQRRGEGRSGVRGSISRWGGITLSAIAILTLMAKPALAQMDPVEWSLEEVPESLSAGEWGELVVRAVMEPGWHIYSLTQPRPPIATQIRVGPHHLAQSRLARQPSPIKRYDDAFDMETEFFEDEVTFQVPFRVVRNEAGRQDLIVELTYQPCTDRICLPPTNHELHLSLAVLEGEIDPADLEVAVGGTGGEGGDEIILPSISLGAGEADEPVEFGTTAGSDGLGGFLLLAIAMGALTLLTPCVFPMIPITVSFFTNRGDGARGRHIRDALLYGGGIVIAFSGLGLLLALIYGATGINRFATNPWINLVVAAIFIGFAFALLGSWQIRLPWRLANLLHSRSEGGGLGGLLFMGVAFAITTFTCTVPFVGTLLVAAADGAWVRPIAGMLVFSTVLALPFVLLALFPAVLQALPKSGSWLGALMVILGLIELGAAFKFLSNADLIWRWGILHREVVLALWIALSVLAALYLLRQIRLPGEESADPIESIGIGRMLTGGAFLALALFLLPGLFGRHVGEIDAFLPPAVYPGTEASGVASTGGSARDERATLAWIDNYDDGLVEAMNTGKPIFIDFTGYTCTNCRWMEANIFTRGDVRERFEQYVLIKLYTDGRGENYTRNQNMQRDRFGTVALPLYVVLTPDGETIATFPGLTRDPKEFLRFLDQGLQSGPGERLVALTSE